MRKASSLMLALLLLVSLTACNGGKSDDPNIGKWNAVSASMLGLDMEVAEMFESGVTLELKPGGRFTLHVDGEKGSGKWAYTDDVLSFTASGMNMTGSIENGRLTLSNLLTMGIDLIFEKEGGYQGGASATATPKAMSEAGYYVLSWGSEGGETISGDDLRAMGLDYYIVLNEDGTAVFQTDNTVSGTWENGVITLRADDITQALPYTVKDSELTVEADGLKMVFVRSDATPPKQQTPVNTPPAAENLNALQQWWNGDWYGYAYLPTADGAWEPLEDGFWDCFAVIQSDATGAGSIYLWDDGGELGDVVLEITEQGVSSAGVAMSQSGTFNKAQIERAQWIIDPGTNTQDYANLIIIDGTFEDPDGSQYGGFMYEIWLRPWGMLWQDVPQSDRPPGYADWYLERYTGAMPTMSEFLSSLDTQPGTDTQPDGSMQMTTVDFDAFTIGCPASATCEENWLGYHAIKDGQGRYEVQISQQSSEDRVAVVREEMAAYLKDPEAKGATTYSRSIGGMHDVYGVKYDSIIWNEAMFSIAYPQPINGYYGVQLCVKTSDTKRKIDDLLALPEVHAILESIVFKG